MGLFSCFGPYRGKLSRTRDFNLFNISQMSPIDADYKERIEIGNCANIAGHGGQNPMK